jgi:hypothetical protein
MKGGHATKLCVPEVPMSKDLLFGDDITKTIKDISEADVIGKKLPRENQTTSQFS